MRSSVAMLRGFPLLLLLASSASALLLPAWAARNAAVRPQRVRRASVARMIKVFRRRPRVDLDASTECVLHNEDDITWPPTRAQRPKRGAVSPASALADFSTLVLPRIRFAGEYLCTSRVRPLGNANCVVSREVPGHEGMKVWICSAAPPSDHDDVRALLRGSARSKPRAAAPSLPACSLLLPARAHSWAPSMTR